MFAVSQKAGKKAVFLSCIWMTQSVYRDYLYLSHASVVHPLVFHKDHTCMQPKPDQPVFVVTCGFWLPTQKAYQSCVKRFFWYLFSVSCCMFLEPNCLPASFITQTYSTASLPWLWLCTQTLSVQVEAQTCSSKFISNRHFSCGNVTYLCSLSCLTLMSLFLPPAFSQPFRGCYWTSSKEAVVRPLWRNG